MACRTTGLLLIDKGEIEPGINVIEKILVNWLRQAEGGLHTPAQLNTGKNMIYTQDKSEDLWITSEESFNNSVGRTIAQRTSPTTADRPGTWMIGKSLSTMESKEPDNKHGRNSPRIDPTTEELKEG
eukprot:4435660-Heterocapsa_arctica.AAC.1